MCSKGGKPMESSSSEVVSGFAALGVMVGAGIGLMVAGNSSWYTLETGALVVCGGGLLGGGVMGIVAWFVKSVNET